MPGGKLHLFGLFDGNKQIGFQCFANYVPIKNNKTPIFHSNRTVIHPDYQGFGLGMKLINETSHFVKTKFNYRVMAKFSSIPVYKSMIKNPDWKLLKVIRTMGKIKTGGNLQRNQGIKGGKFGVGGFREGGTRTFSFEYIKK